MDEDDEADEGADVRENTRTRLLRAAVALSKSTKKISLTERVEALGFGVETASVFDLLPLIHVAWADGKVQPQERAAIMRVLAAREIEAGEPAHVMIEALLEEHPGQEYMDETLAVLRAIVARNTRRAEAILDLCFMVAEAHDASAHDIDSGEKRALDQVAEALGERAQAWIEAKLLAKGQARESSELD